MTYGGAVLKMHPMSRDELRANLVDSGIAGEVATPRENNLSSFQRMSSRDPRYLFGLEPKGTWSPADVLTLMTDRCGVSPDPDHRYGQDTIDPDRTIARLDALAERLHQAARRQERVFVATGHPVGLWPTHAAIAESLCIAGCTLMTPTIEWQHPDNPAYGQHHGVIGYRQKVGVLIGVSGRLLHTHSPLPMQEVLSHLSARGESAPNLVVADHGWAGAAGEAGLGVGGFADCNDPALFVGEAEGRVQVSVPLDDNVAPELYAPLTLYLLNRAGLSCA